MSAPPIVGRCHCGNLRLTLRTARDPAALGRRRCACSFCTGRRLRWTSDPAGAVEITVAEEAELSRYRFATGTADFLICRRCGQVVAALTIDAPRRAVINVDALAEPERFADAEARDFDGEALADRLARRARSWTPARLVVAGAAEPAEG
ncbi:MAG: hypothetical protein R3A79_12105 [Nannocystaceae bacterium]